MRCLEEEMDTVLLQDKTFVEGHVMKFTMSVMLQCFLCFLVCREFVKHCHNWFYSPLHRKFTRCGGAVFIKCLYKQHDTGEFSVFAIGHFCTFCNIPRSSQLHC